MVFFKRSFHSARFVLVRASPQTTPSSTTATKTSGGYSKRDPLIAKQLQPVVADECVNVFTEAVRLKKATRILLTDKLSTELPSLKRTISTLWKIDID
jgi:hypothetical protein